MRLAAEGGNLERVYGFQVKFYLEVKGGPAAGRVSGSGSHYKYTNIIVFTSIRRKCFFSAGGPATGRVSGRGAHYWYTKKLFFLLVYEEIVFLLAYE